MITQKNAGLLELFFYFSFRAKDSNEEQCLHSVVAWGRARIHYRHCRVFTAPQLRLVERAPVEWPGTFGAASGLPTTAN